MYPQDVIEYMMKRAEFKARQIVKRIPSLGEVEDVQQDLIADVLRSLPRFNGDLAGVKTFICRVISNRIGDLLKSHEAASRGNGCAKDSLDDWVRDETGSWVRRDTIVEESRGRAHVGVARRSDHERRDLEMDIAGVMATLSDQQQAICAMLKTKTPTAIIRESGIARSVLYKHIAAIREAFIQAGLADYV